MPWLPPSLPWCDPASDQTELSVWIAFRADRFAFAATSATVRSSSPKL